ncbi:hypothetical protein P775_07795 [Puniceibacterium antarcticum]|uniref:Uncharacterized protein n=1 Tax=Puniceibacterium antarcticum TaxID=1206336 RepID=A0A2G8RGZ9_9RHOB|nr:hypothetical protein P775_07795 [Puniceibacterium antarcticum]
MFEWGRLKVPTIDEDQVKELQAKIGEMAAANFFGKKAQALRREGRRGMIKRGHLDLSIGQSSDKFPRIARQP